MTNHVFFSIVIPTYNRAVLISKTIESLLNLKYEHFEIIVVDDGSTDDTEAVVTRINSSKIAYHKITNSERGYARNYGARLAKGDYINFFDSDDLVLEDHLVIASKTIGEKNDPEIFHLNYAVLNPDLSLVHNRNNEIGSANEKLIFGNNLSCNGVFIKREIAMKFPFNESRKLSISEDWDLWLRLSARYTVHLIPIVTSYIVNHDERSVMTFNEQKLLDRTNELINSLSNDKVFIEVYPNSLNKIRAHMLSYMSLHAALCNYKKKAVHYLFQSLRVNHREIFNRRFLAILKHLAR